LLILNGGALSDDVRFVIEVWSMSTDVHLGGDWNTSTISTDLPFAIIEAVAKRENVLSRALTSTSGSC